MLLLLLVLVLSPSIPAVASIRHVVNITEENTGAVSICSNINSLEQDTCVVLSTSITHYISSNASLCVISTTYSLTLTTDSSSPAVMQCNQKWSTTGFDFSIVHNLTLQRLALTGCGGL